MARPSRLAIVTGHHAPDLSDDGQRLAAALADRGIESEPVMWDDPGTDWAAYDAVLFRSCWDYPDDVERFLALLDELDASGLPVCNPLAAIRWNLHKGYLLELADAGVAVPDTRLLERGSSTELGAVLAGTGWDQAIVKPAVGAFSTDVWRTSAPPDADAAARFDALLADGDVVVQAFYPEIVEGERSIVAFAGEYSHAWNSLPEPDDVTAFANHDPDYEPPVAIRRQAIDALQAARDCLGLEVADLPYARVDYVIREDRLVLFELELIEPFLGFERGSGAVERFCDAVVAYVERGEPGRA